MNLLAAQVLENGYFFFIVKMYFASAECYQNFSFSAPLHSSVTLDSNKKVSTWILAGVSAEKFKFFSNHFTSFDTNLVPHV